MTHIDPITSFKINDTFIVILVWLANTQTYV